MSLPIISQPDISSAQLQDSITAAQSVTLYTQAVITLVPELDDMPAWYTPINNDITTVQTHAQGWISNICPLISNSVPQSIIQFNQDFQSSSAGVIDTLQQIVQQSGSLPTDQQRTAIDNYLLTIQSSAAVQSNTVNSILQSVKAFAANANTDQALIANDISILTTNITNAAKSIDQMQAAIGENFIDNNVLGACNVIVNINMSISIKVAGLNIDPTIISTIYAQAILQNMDSNIQMAQKNLQAVVDGWSIMLQKFADIKSDLQDATADQYAADLQLLDFTIAQTQWQQLADFATTLVPNQLANIS